jgi:uncharacterized membrane protein
LKLSNLINEIRIITSDNIAKYIATWSFVILYTIAMLSWIILHKFKILNIDTEDFIKYSLFLSWLSGIQASIVLMSSNRQAECDRNTLLKGVELDLTGIELDKKALSNVEKIIKKLNTLDNKIKKLNEIIELIEVEENKKFK